MNIFLSYSRIDAQDIGENIHDYLKDLGINVFIDLKNIKLGEDWNNSIDAHIASCDTFIIIFTPAVMRSENVRKEVLYAKHQNKRIIPCFYKNIKIEEVPWGLNNLQGIKFENVYHLIRNLGDMLDEELTLVNIGDSFQDSNTMEQNINNSIFGISNSATEWWICQVCNDKFPTYKVYSKHFSQVHK